MKHHFTGWWQSAITPNLINTPDGAIDVRWRSNVNPEPTERAEAAARLIAAAPDLLAALQAVISDSKLSEIEMRVGQHYDGEFKSETVTACLNAVKRATEG